MLSLRSEDIKTFISFYWQVLLVRMYISPRQMQCKIYVVDSNILKIYVFTSEDIDHVIISPATFVKNKSHGTNKCVQMNV